jgi:hypothetical protein
MFADDAIEVAHQAGQAAGINLDGECSFGDNVCRRPPGGNYEQREVDASRPIRDVALASFETLAC